MSTAARSSQGSTPIGELTRGTRDTAAFSDRALPIPPGVDERWETSDRIGLALIRLIRIIERTKQAKVGHDGVERAAYVLLARLVLEGPHRSNALAEAVRSDPSTVSRQIAGLVRAGLVERRPDPDDGRACLLAASDEGLRVFEANRDRRNTEITALTEHWDEDDRRTFVALLHRFVVDLADHHNTDDHDRADGGAEGAQ